MSLQNLSYRNLLFVFASWWLLWIILHVFIVQGVGFGWNIALVDSLLTNGLLVAACIGITTILKYYLPQRNSSFNLLPWTLILALLCVSISQASLSFVFSSEEPYLHFLDQSWLLRYCVAFLMIGWMVLLNWMWRTIQTQQEQDTRKVDLQMQVKEAELSSLQQKLQPHFLFNSLNSINALIGSQPEQARNMIQQLSDFMRTTIKREDGQFISLEEELYYLQLYFNIEKVRFGHRLTIDIKADEESLKGKVPALVLQPVVENAIKFGLYDTTENITIKIKTQIEKSALVFSVENPFDPHTSVAKKGTGFGLKSIERRLYLLYARNDLLQTEQNGNIFITNIRIPQNNG